MTLTLDKEGKKKQQAAVIKPFSHDAEHLIIIDFLCVLAPSQYKNNRDKSIFLN